MSSQAGTQLGDTLSMSTFCPLGLSPKIAWTDFACNGEWSRKATEFYSCKGHFYIGRSWGPHLKVGSRTPVFFPVTLRSRTFLGFVNFASPVLESKMGIDLKTCTLVVRDDYPLLFDKIWENCQMMYTFKHNLFRVFKITVDWDFIKHCSVKTISDW